MKNKSEILFDNNFLKIKRADGWYLFAERLGIDSVAFILYDENKTKPFCLINEIKPPLYERGVKRLTTAFGGSLDKNKHMDYIVKDEVEEEAGYHIADNEMDRIEYLGKVFVSTQMNQFVHLYFVNVTGLKQGNQNLEKNEDGQPVWMSKKEILNGVDWKAITILAKKNLLC